MLGEVRRSPRAELSKDEWKTLPIAYESAEALADMAASSSQGDREHIESVWRLILRAIVATRDKGVEPPVAELGLDTLSSSSPPTDP